MLQKDTTSFRAIKVYIFKQTQNCFLPVNQKLSWTLQLQIKQTSQFTMYRLRPIDKNYTILVDATGIDLFEYQEMIKTVLFV